MDIASLIALLGIAIDNVQAIGKLIDQHQKGQQPTPEQIAAAHEKTADLLSQLHQLLPTNAGN